MVSLLGLGRNGANPVTESLIKWLEDQLAARRVNYDLCRSYYQGDHPVRLTNRLKAYVQQSGLTFTDNYMDVVVDALAERLAVTGFSTDNDALDAYLSSVWSASKMDGGQVVVHTEAVMLGDAYVLVDWDEEHGRARFTPQPAEFIVPHYDETSRRMDWCSKKWLVTTQGGQPVQAGETPPVRLNLYFPDRIEKYVSGRATWQHWQDEGEESWPLPWVDAAGDPLGIPVMHFRNKVGVGDYGDSEIQDTIPLQDLLNKTMVDLMMVLDTLAFQQRWTLDIFHGAGSGITAASGVTAAKIDIVPGSISEFHSAGETPGSVGQWDAADPAGLLQSLEVIVQHIAGTSRTPQHLFQIMGGAPSGEALKTAEAGLVHKAKRRQLDFGNTWEQALQMAVRLEGVFGSQRLDATSAITVQWADPESRNDEAHIAGLEGKMRLGVPKKQIWRELGYTEDQIVQMEADLLDERAADSNLGAEILRRFSQGAGAGAGGAEGAVGQAGVRGAQP